MQVAGNSLLARLFTDRKPHRSLASRRQARAPFPIAAVEQQDVCVCLEAQHVDKVVGLIAIQRDLGVLAERSVDEKPGRAEIITRHRVRLSPRGAGLPPLPGCAVCPLAAGFDPDKGLDPGVSPGPKT